MEARSEMEFNKLTPADVAAIEKLASEVILPEAIHDDFCHDELAGERHRPDLLVRAHSAAEVSAVLKYANEHHIPVTPRGQGTGLVGGSVCKFGGIMLDLTRMNRILEIDQENLTLTVEPGVLLMEIAPAVEPLGLFYPPDPGEKSASIGGNISTNAGGMRAVKYGVTRDYVRALEVVLADGRVLELGGKVVKNSSGYNLMNLIVGSEGTLAFLSEVTVKTEHDFPFKASAMLYFRDIREACKAVVMFSKMTDEAGNRIVKGAELLDKKSLSSVNDTTGEGLTAILTEVKGNSQEELVEHIAEITKLLEHYELAVPVYFTDKEEEYSKYWAIRSGIFPSVGGTRPLGTTCLIEDVAFHIQDLPEAVADLQDLMEKHGYHDACIYGHSLEGNFHFIINQSFDTEQEIQRYENLMNDVIALVVDKYDGSLKAEHGTGRNMAPFVEYEWGKEAFEVMKDVKKLFDPKNMMNPGVIFNDDPKCHLKNLKPLPVIELKNGKKGHKADKCIECGFCEINCLSAGFTLSARQRIVSQREISRLRRSGENPQRLVALEKEYVYVGEQTCAVDGLCATSCPMGIDTGDLTHDIREANIPKGSVPYKIGDFAANHLSGIKSSLRPLLGVANAAHSVIGSSAVNNLGKGLNKIGFPLWTSSLPKPYHLKQEKIPAYSSERKVVYFPSCINQTMGVSKNAPDQTPLTDKMLSMLKKVGYEVIFPKGMERMCCGTIWESKGMYDIADRKSSELDEALWEASEQGKYPVLCDQSPCLKRMRHKITRMKLYEPAEFIYDFLRDKLTFNPTNEPVALHITCSMKKMELENKIISLTKLCSKTVIIPSEVGCCGFAGDRGFTYPELNEYALRKLHPQIEKAGVKLGYSNSRTCEIGLETNAGIPYVSIVYLVDEVTSSSSSL